MDEKTIGSTIRRIRRQNRLTLENVAQKVNLSIGTLSKIERGVISTPISTLIRLVDVLGVNLADIVSEPADGKPGYAVTRRGKGVEIHDKDHRHTFEALTVAMPSKLAEAFIYTRKPRNATLKEALSSPFELESIGGHAYHDGREFTLVLSGTLVLVVEDDVVVLKHGDSVLIDATYRHGEFVVGKNPAKYLRMYLKDPG